MYKFHLKTGYREGKHIINWQVQQGFRKLLDNLKSPKNVTLLLGQKAYANKQFELNPKFEDDTKRYFDSEAQNLDFSRNQEAAEIINNWVCE